MKRIPTELKWQRPHNAGGFQVAYGHRTLFRLLRPYQIQRWRTLIKAWITTMRKHDIRIDTMLIDASCEWHTYDTPPPYHRWPKGSPEQKKQSLISYILRQKGPHNLPLDILASGLAGRLWWEHHVQPRHDDYTRAVDTARPILFLHRPVWRTFERDNGHGSVTATKVKVNRMVRLTSRNACQHIEREVLKHAGWVLEEYRGQLEEVLRRDGRIQ